MKITFDQDTGYWVCEFKSMTFLTFNPYKMYQFIYSYSLRPKLKTDKFKNTKKWSVGRAVFGDRRPLPKLNKCESTQDRLIKHHCMIEAG
jgi:hypothetical protein